MLFGIDLSNNNGYVNWFSVAKDIRKVSFCYAKATEGTTFSDSQYHANRAGAHAHDIAFGAYHFARPDLGNPIGQAKHFAEVATPHAHDLRPMVDIEGTLRASELTFLVELCREIDKLTKTVCGIYLSPSDAHELDTARWGGLGKRPLWLAAWGDSVPTPPLPWHRVSVWQSSGTGHVEGVGSCDLDWLVDPFAALRI